MRSSIKSFCKIFSLSNTQASSIEFRDTLGSAIVCNYFRVDSRSIGNNDLGWFHVYPNGVYASGVPLASTSGVGTTAGAPGLAGVADGSVEYSLPKGSSYLVSSIVVTNLLGDTGSFAVTYGILGQSPDMADFALQKINGNKGV